MCNPVKYYRKDDAFDHQIPSNPRGVIASAIANGILDPVNTILMMLHSLVLPRPDSAPIVISSTLINASLIPMIRK